jgi:hypothetical protein
MFGAISKDKTLRLFLAVLSLSNILSALHWGPWDRLFEEVFHGGEAYCWPFWPSCGTSLGRDVVSANLEIFLLLLGGLAVVSATLFWMGRALAVAWMLSALAWGLKIGLSLLDYRFSGNFHYMINILWALVLFFPRKKDTALLMIVSFYVAASFLKLNTDWLGGWAFIRRPVLEGTSLKFASAYVLVLELVLVWGLLSPRRFWFWSTWFQLLGFHLFSWHIVGYFYPATMFLVLSLPLIHRFRGEVFGASRVFWPAIVAFWLAQVVPMVIPGDSAVTGEGRLFSVSMLDSYVECRAFLLSGDGPNASDLSRDSRGLGVRLGCDPVILWNRARSLCEKSSQPLRVAFFSKRRSEERYRALVDEANFCAIEPSYSVWRRNEWIKAHPEGREALPRILLQPAPSSDREFRSLVPGRIEGVSHDLSRRYWITAVGDEVGASQCRADDGALWAVARNVGAYGDSFESRVVALRQDTGEAQWVSPVLSSTDLTLSCAAGELYVFDGLGLLSRLDPSTGAVRWSRFFQKPLKSLSRSNGVLSVLELDGASRILRAGDGGDVQMGGP